MQKYTLAQKKINDGGDFLGDSGYLLGDGSDLLGDGGSSLGNLLGGAGDLLGVGGDLLGDGCDRGEYFYNIQGQRMISCVSYGLFHECHVNAAFSAIYVNFFY